MDPNYVRQMFELGGTLIINGLPKGTEFGIDLMSWNIEERFKGIKMIPPGLHFIYHCIVSKDGQKTPRSGFFHYFEEKEILIKEYSTVQEDICDDNDEEKVGRIKFHLKDLDKNLLPYPFESWSKWISFSQHIDKDNLRRLEPQSGKICTVELINEDTFRQKKSRRSSMDASTSESNYLPSTEDNNCLGHETPTASAEKSDQVPSTSRIDSPRCQSKLPVMVPCPGTEIFFTKVPDKPHKEGASPAEISRGNLDSSYTMSVILDQLDRPESILSEIQFAFICFLVGQVWEGWEQWRQLVILLCKAEETLLSHPSLYSNFLSILYYQVQEIPEDLFCDIVESNNFMVMSLRTVFANIFDNACSLPIALVSKAKKFRKNLSLKYKWNLVLEEEEEDKPVVVET